MAGLGTQVASQPETYLRDAQGQRISTHDVRDVNFSFHATDGSVVNVKERAFFSDTIDSPLISFGKLVKAGWGIETSCNGSPMLAHPSGARVELAFRNNSLTISGNVRVVQHVRKIGVDIPRSWQSLRQGWYETDNLQICSSGGNRFVDATTDYLSVNGRSEQQLVFMTHVVGKSLSFVSVCFQWKSVLLQFKVTIKSF